MNPLKTRPKVVAMIGLGPSHYDFVTVAGCKKDFLVPDEVWGVNSTLGVYNLDKCFVMDDLIQIRQTYPQWAGRLATTTVPIITCRAYKEFPTSIAFPIKEVMECVKDDLFTTSVAYMIGYAMLTNVRELYLFGMDFQYPGGSAKEPGAEAVAYLLGMAKERGVNYHIPQSSTLLDANLTKMGEDGRPHRPMYGYDYNPGIAKKYVEQGRATPLEKAVASKAPYVEKPDKSQEAKKPGRPKKTGGGK